MSSSFGDDHPMEEEASVQASAIGAADNSVAATDDDSIAVATAAAMDGDGSIIDEESTAQEVAEEDDEGENATVKSELTHDEDASTVHKKTKTSTNRKSPSKKKPSSAKKGRAPAVEGLTIPFRAVKRTMKLDPDIATVQNEAAIMTTLAAELFLKSLAKESHQNAKSRGRNTIRYEDVAEARTKDPALAFLDIILP